MNPNTIEVAVRIRCGKCGFDLDYDDLGHRESMGLTLIDVSPCETCMEEARDTGIKEGKDEGRREALEEQRRLDTAAAPEEE